MPKYFPDYWPKSILILITLNQTRWILTELLITNLPYEENIFHYLLLLVLNFASILIS